MNRAILSDFWVMDIGTLKPARELAPHGDQIHPCYFTKPYGLRDSSGFYVCLLVLQRKVSGARNDGQRMPSA